MANWQFQNCHNWPNFWQCHNYYILNQQFVAIQSNRCSSFALKIESLFPTAAFKSQGCASLKKLAWTPSIKAKIRSFLSLMIVLTNDRFCRLMISDFLQNTFIYDMRSCWLVQLREAIYRCDIPYVFRSLSSVN